MTDPSAFVPKATDVPVASLIVPRLTGGLPHGDERVQAAFAKLGKTRAPRPTPIVINIRDVIRRVAPRPDVGKTQSTFLRVLLNAVHWRLKVASPAAMNGRRRLENIA